MSESKIPQRWLPVVRALWFVLVLLLLLFYIAGIPTYFNVHRVPCGEVDCPILTLTAQEAQGLLDLGLSLDLYAGYIVALDIYSVAILVPLAGLIFWRKSDTWLGLLLSLALAYFAFITSLSGVTFAGQHPILRWPYFLMDMVASVLFVLLFYLFPDGRFVPRWTRFIIVIFIGSFLIDFLRFTPDLATPSYSEADEIFWLLTLLIGALAQIYRYRRVSNPTQRQQTKWIMFGLVIVFMAALVWTTLTVLSPPESASIGLTIKLGFGFAVLMYTILPVSVVSSILRYRLWDIDIIINRTLVYGLLTATLALFYFGSVVLLQSLFRSVSDQGSQLAVVASTLVIATLFNPLRRRIQSIIDRRFYRRKYDAAQTLADFSAIARDEVDLEVLAAALMKVVQETMQPAHCALWLAPSQGPAGDIRAYQDDVDNRNSLA